MDIYQALGAPALFALGHRSVSPVAVWWKRRSTRRWGGTFDDAQALLVSRFARITLAQLAGDFRKGMAAHKRERKCVLEH